MRPGMRLDSSILMTLQADADAGRQVRWHDLRRYAGQGVDRVADAGNAGLAEHQGSCAGAEGAKQ